MLHRFTSILIINNRCMICASLCGFITVSRFIFIVYFYVFSNTLKRICLCYSYIYSVWLHMLRIYCKCIGEYLTLTPSLFARKCCDFWKVRYRLNYIHIGYTSICIIIRVLMQFALAFFALEQVIYANTLPERMNRSKFRAAILSNNYVPFWTGQITKRHTGSL